jgi:hypothetical protein
VTSRSCDRQLADLPGPPRGVQQRDRTSRQAPVRPDTRRYSTDTPIAREVPATDIQCPRVSPQSQGRSSKLRRFRGWDLLCRSATRQVRHATASRAHVSGRSGAETGERLFDASTTLVQQRRMHPQRHRQDRQGHADRRVTSRRKCPVERCAEIVDPRFISCRPRAADCVSHSATACSKRSR